jgi:release factor glutamine methyltransferase
VGTRRFDLIVSNPPYITTAELVDLQPEVRDFEPRLALDGGLDGLTAYRQIVSLASAHLVPSGYLVVEVGAGQAPEVSELFVEAGFNTIVSTPDSAGIQRVVGGVV